VSVELQHAVDLVDARERLCHRLRTQALRNGFLPHAREPSSEIDIGRAPFAKLKREREQNTHESRRHSFMT
jgi:hypothetical protein